MSFAMNTNIQQHWKTWEELQGLKAEYKTLQEKYKANVEAYNSQLNELKATQEQIKQQESVIADLQARFDAAIYQETYIRKNLQECEQELALYKNWYKNIQVEHKQQQEQIETLRFDNEHLQKDVAEKDLQIAALKNQVDGPQEPFFIHQPLSANGTKLEHWKEKPDNLEKEKEYWKDAAKNARKDVAHWESAAYISKTGEAYWKAQAEDLRRKNEAYEKLLKSILEYAQTTSRSEK